MRKTRKIGVAVRQGLTAGRHYAVRRAGAVSMRSTPRTAAIPAAYFTPSAQGIPVPICACFSNRACSEPRSQSSATRVHG